MKFKEGDRVVLIKHDSSNWNLHTDVPLNSEGIILRISAHDITVEFKCTTCFVPLHCISFLSSNKEFIEELL